MGMPIVSIIMSVYNSENYLFQAIASISCQTFEDFEFIIIDDGSTDNSSRIIDSFNDHRIKSIRHDNQGLAFSLNVGIRLSRGKYIARMDSDDISEKNRIKKQVEFLDNNPGYAICGTNALVMTEDSTPLYYLNLPQSDEEIRRQLFETYNSPLVHGSVIFHKDAAVRSGLYDNKMRTSQDFALWRRMAHYGKLSNISEALYRYRINPSALSTLPQKLGTKKMKIIQRTIDAGNITDQDAVELDAILKKADASEKRTHYEIHIGKVYQSYLNNQAMARKHFKKAVVASPLNVNAWINLIFTYFPIAFVLSLKRLYFGKASSIPKSVEPWKKPLI
jgi:glycosyltransferase involved in cell wall biosynthesis